MSDMPDRKDLMAFAKWERHVFDRFSQETCDRMLDRIETLQAELDRECLQVSKHLLPEAGLARPDRLVGWLRIKDNILS